jgi:spore protease
MSEDFQPVAVHTDMALEARDLVRGRAGGEVPGVRVDEEAADGVRITRVTVETAAAATLMGKPQGRYVTCDVPAFKDRDAGLRQRATDRLASELAPLVNDAAADQRDRHVLVVGLGNWNATPDALGPRVVDRVLVTRHLSDLVPADLRRRMRMVSAVAPGVLGTTGIETVDIIRGIVRETAPDVVVAVDALAARSLERLVASIQLADTGIHPGSGVGNRRHGITRESIGVPVVAVGVPTVVAATGIVLEAVQLLVDQLRGEAALYRVIEEMEAGEQRQLIEDVVAPRMGELMVTPKEIDVLVNDMADVVAEALNRALQPDLDPAEWH